MTDREIMQQALEYIKETYNFCVVMQQPKEQEEQLIKALEAALAQPEQEPVAKHICNLWINPETSSYEVDRCTHPINEVIPVYTAPPRKEWVGLTDEEIKDILDCERGGLVDIKKAEQILKEKNGG